MKKQVFNPILPLHEYIPDNEPKKFGDRIYIYGSHDQEKGQDYCLLDYVCYSAAENDLGNWRYEGVIYEKTADPTNLSGVSPLFSPDVCMGEDGRYYLYYQLSGKGVISVAVCDTPAGKFKYYGTVSYENGVPMRENNPFSPGIINDEGRIFLYYGFAPTPEVVNIIWYKDSYLPGCSVVELGSDMKTVISGPTIVLPSEHYSQGTGFEGHEYFEGPSIRKIGDLYYLVYCSIQFHELCYATSKYPDRDFTYGGVILSNADIGLDGRTYATKVNYIGNNQGGMIKIKDQWYLFYHRQTHGTGWCRQGCAEPIYFDEQGGIKQVPITSCGLNGGPLSIGESYPAAICCHLSGDSEKLQFQFGLPYITSLNNERFISHISNGAKFGYKYFDFDKSLLRIKLTYRGQGKGQLNVAITEHGKSLGAVDINPSNADWITSEVRIVIPKGIHPLYFEYNGKGSIQVLEFYIGE